MSRPEVGRDEQPLQEPVPGDAVPGLARVVAELKASFPQLSLEAIARILRMPVVDDVPRFESDDAPKSHHTPDE